MNFDPKAQQEAVALVKALSDKLGVAADQAYKHVYGQIIAEGVSALMLSLAVIAIAFALSHDAARKATWAYGEWREAKSKDTSYGEGDGMFMICLLWSGVAIACGITLVCQLYEFAAALRTLSNAEYHTLQRILWLVGQLR
jgi:hypothetical protein